MITCRLRIYVVSFEFIETESYLTCRIMSYIPFIYWHIWGSMWMFLSLPHHLRRAKVVDSTSQTPEIIGFNDGTREPRCGETGRNSKPDLKIHWSVKHKMKCFNILYVLLYFNDVLLFFGHCGYVHPGGHHRCRRSWLRQWCRSTEPPGRHLGLGQRHRPRGGRGQPSRRWAKNGAIEMWHLSCCMGIVLL